MKFRDLILLYEGNILLEYTEKYIQQQVARLKPQAGYFVDQQAIIDRINRFDQLKSGGTQRDLIRLAKQAVEAGRLPENSRTTIAFAPEVSDVNKTQNKGEYDLEVHRLKKLEANPLEINFYSWKNLEDVIDQFPSDEPEVVPYVGEGEFKNKVYDNDGLEIYYLPNKLISFNTKNYIIKRIEQEGKLRKDGNRLYSWCISYPPDRSLFNSYRMTKNVPQGHAIYMVYDTKASNTSPWHYFIVQVSNSGEGPTGKAGPYYVTDATNGQERYYSWDELVDRVPRIAPAKNALKPVPYTFEEKNQQLLSKATPQNFAKLPYNLKRAYIETCFQNNKQILEKDFGELDNTLQHLYINSLIANLPQESKTLSIYKLLHPFDDSEYMVFTDTFKEALLVAKKLKQKDMPLNTKLLADILLKTSPVKPLSRKAETFNRYRDVAGDLLGNIIEQKLSQGPKI